MFFFNICVGVVLLELFVSFASLFFSIIGIATVFSFFSPQLGKVSGINTYNYVKNDAKREFDIGIHHFVFVFCLFGLGVLRGRGYQINQIRPRARLLLFS